MRKSPYIYSLPQADAGRRYCTATFTAPTTQGRMGFLEHGNHMISLEKKLNFNLRGHVTSHFSHSTISQS